MSSRNSEPANGGSNAIFYFLGILVVFCFYMVFQENRRHEQERAAGMTNTETTMIQGTVDGVKVIEPNNGNAALAGAEGAAISKALGGSNKQAAGAAVANAIIVGLLDHAMAGCYVVFTAEGHQQRVHTQDFVCQKYKVGDQVPVVKTVKYDRLALPGQHPRDKWDVAAVSYTPKFQ